MFLSVQVGVKFFWYSGKAARIPGCGSLTLSCLPCLASAMAARAKSSNASVTPCSSHLGVCLFSRQEHTEAPHVFTANTGRRRGQEILSRPLQGRCKPTAFLAVLSLAGFGFIHSISDYLDCRARDHLLCACFCSLQNKTSIFAASP